MHRTFSSWGARQCQLGDRLRPVDRSWLRDHRLHRRRRSCRITHRDAAGGGRRRSGGHLLLIVAREGAEEHADRQHHEEPHEGAQRDAEPRVEGRVADRRRGLVDLDDVAPVVDGHEQAAQDGPHEGGNPERGVDPLVDVAAQAGDRRGVRVALHLHSLDPLAVVGELEVVLVEPIADRSHLAVEVREVAAHLRLEALELLAPGGRQHGAGLLAPGVAGGLATQQRVELGREAPLTRAEPLEAALVARHVADGGLHLGDAVLRLPQPGLELGELGRVTGQALVGRGDASALAHEVIGRGGAWHNDLLGRVGDMPRSTQF